MSLLLGPSHYPGVLTVMPRIVKLSETRWRIEVGRTVYYVKQSIAPEPAGFSESVGVTAQKYGTYIINDDHCKKVQAMTPEDAITAYLDDGIAAMIVGVRITSSGGQAPSPNWSTP